MSRSQLILFALGLVLSAAAVALLLRSVDFSEAVRALGHASPGWYAAATIVTLIGYFLRALRWRVVLSPEARPPVSRLFSATMVGFLAINALPARLGEFVRAYVLARTERLSTATVLGSVAAERILDIATLGAFWALSLLFAPFPDWFRFCGYLTVGAGAAAGIILWALHSARGSAESWINSSLLSKLPTSMTRAISTAVPAFGAGLRIFSMPALAIRAWGWSMAAWLVSGAVFLFVGESMGMPLPFWSIFLLSFIVSVGVSLPSSPGFIGVLEGACVVGLSLLGIAGPQALAFAILYHLTQIVPLLLLGTYFAVREHVTLGQIGCAEGANRGLGRKG